MPYHPPPMPYEHYHHMPQQMDSGVSQAAIGHAQYRPGGFNTGISGRGPSIETSGAHAPEGRRHEFTEPSSREQGNDRIQLHSPARSNKTPRGNKRPSCEWSDAENEFLVMCKRAGLGNGGRPSKGKANCTDWDEISAKFRVKFGDRGQVKSSDQIRQKWDTFLKSHKIIKKFLSQKNYSQLADKEFGYDVGDLKQAIKIGERMVHDHRQVPSELSTTQLSDLRFVG